MAVTAPAPRVLADVIPRSVVRDILLIIGGAALVGILAQLSYNVPGTPILLTGQTFGVLLVGASLGAVRGMVSMLFYGVAGLVGVPWFASFSTGFSPWFGYIIGFIAGAGLVGWLAERGWTRTVVDTALAMVLGNVAIYACGVVWLKYAGNYSWATAVFFGMSVYLVGDGIKIALASGAFPLVWKQLVKRDLAPRVEGAEVATAAMAGEDVAGVAATTAETTAEVAEDDTAAEMAAEGAEDETAAEMAAEDLAGVATTTAEADAEVGATTALSEADEGVALSEADEGVALTEADEGVALTEADEGVALSEADAGVALSEADAGVALSEADAGVALTEADAGDAAEASDADTAGESDTVIDLTEHAGAEREPADRAD